MLLVQLSTLTCAQEPLQCNASLKSVWEVLVGNKATGVGESMRTVVWSLVWSFELMDS